MKSLRNIFLVFFVVVVLSGCKNDSDDVLKKGSYVRHKLDGRVGMILYRDGADEYFVRFSILTEKTDTHFFSSDGPVKIEPYADIYCREYEIEHISKEEAEAWRKHVQLPKEDDQ